MLLLILLIVLINENENKKRYEILVYIPYIHIKSFKALGNRHQQWRNYERKRNRGST